MGWVVSVGTCYIPTKDGLKPVPSEIIKSEGIAVDYVLGPHKGYFRAKQELEARFKGITNFDYQSDTEGVVKEHPYVRHFEIFEYSDKELDAQLNQWDKSKNNPGVW